MTTSEQQAVPVAQIDWWLIAKAAGEHGVRYRTNRAMLRFLSAIEPARKADRFESALPCKSGEGAPGWIVGNPIGQWRTFDSFGWAWTDRRDLAVRYARRVDAELVHGEDNDAWRVEQFSAALTPDATQTREAELVAALEALVTAAAEYQEAAQSHISDTRYDEDGNLAARDAELSVVALPTARAALNARGGA